MTFADVLEMEVGELEDWLRDAIDYRRAVNAAAAKG